MTRDILLTYLAQSFSNLPKSRSIIAIDGVDGSGKTTFADALAHKIEFFGKNVIRASVDGFHNPRNVRYARGRYDPAGYFHDSYNYEGFRSRLIEPFKNASSVETAIFDHRTDQPVTSAIQEVSRDAILVIDGIFLHREELKGLWDQSIYLDVPFSVTHKRMVVRDKANPDLLSDENQRYVQGQKIYLETCRPDKYATYVIDNTDFGSPKILTP